MQDLQLLPRRKSQQMTKLVRATPIKYFTNLYEIEFGSKNNFIYQFSMEPNPEIPKDSSYLYRLIYKNIYKQLKQSLKDVITSGSMLWGLKNLSQPKVFQVEFTVAEIQHKYDILIRPVREIDFLDFMKDKDLRPALMQILNSKVKSTCQYHLNYVELSQSKWFNPKASVIQNLGLEYRRGFKMTLCPIGNQMSIQIDVCSKINRLDNFLVELSKESKQSASKYIGVTLITRYGKIKTYRIESIDYQLTPMSKFYSDQQAGEITYAEYYQKSYGIKVINKNQPLIKVLRNKEKKMKDGKIIEIENFIYLIPELVSLTGMSDADRANHNAMKQIAPYTKLEPKERAEQNERLIQNFNKDKNNEFIKIKRQKTVSGFLLNNVRVSFGENNIEETNDGSLNSKNKIKAPAQFKDWVIVYSLSNNPKYDDSDADKVNEYLIKCAPAFSIKIKDANFITVQGKTAEDWIKQIQNDIKKNGKPQIIVLLFQKHEQKFYGKLKRYLTCEQKLQSQVIRRRTLANQQPSRNMSAASKILLQMNAKLGFPLWQIVNKPFGKKNIMYGAISISKGKGGYTLAFVGTIDKNLTKIYSQAISGIKKKQQIPQATFDSIFKNWAKNYFKQNNGGYPDMIIVYRQGLAEAQVQKCVRPEVRSLQKTVQIIGQKAKLQKYNPQVLLIGVNKKISMRFYNSSGKNQGGKFLPNLSNPDSGSVVIEELSVGNMIDFHLAAQKVTQGTCTPTQYIALYKNFDIPMESLIEFTYGQCFNYYNWTGAVRVPACLQCADKLSKLVGESIQENLTGLGELQKTYHFL